METGRGGQRNKMKKENSETWEGKEEVKWRKENMKERKEQPHK